MRSSIATLALAAALVTGLPERAALACEAHESHSKSAAGLSKRGLGGGGTDDDIQVEQGSLAHARGATGVDDQASAGGGTATPGTTVGAGTLPTGTGEAPAARAGATTPEQARGDLLERYGANRSALDAGASTLPGASYDAPDFGLDDRARRPNVNESY